MTAIDSLMSADMREAIRLTREGHMTDIRAVGVTTGGDACLRHAS